MNLKTKLADTFPLQKKQKNALNRLGIETVGDLMYHFPARYITQKRVTRVADVEVGMDVVLFGRLKNLETQKSPRQGIPLATGEFEDGTGTLDIVWFHQPYIAEMVTDGQPVKLTGAISERSGGLQITNPEFEKVSQLPDHGPLFADDTTGFILPVYPESDGVSSRWMYHKIRTILTDDDLQASLADPLPKNLRAELSLPEISKAFIWMHTPKKQQHAEIARKRFAFEEVFAVQIIKQKARRQHDMQESFPIDITYEQLGDFLERFDFTPTIAQKRSIKEILSDFRSENAMRRLLEGDVGSGKTFVAAVTAYAAVTTPPKGREHGHLQTAYMAPTEILAKQQFASFVDYFAHLPIATALITGSGCRKFPSKIDDTKATDISRNQLLKWIEEGVVSVVFGTHSLIQDDIQFDNLAYVIIDEQHRFGVKQRKKLMTKDGPTPHLLSMTATPIPRTLALTLYGDLDLSVIDELPPGRETAETKLVSESDRKQAYEFLENKLSSGQQAYVVCPRIEKPDPDKENQLDVMSVEVMEDKITDRFSDYGVDTLHGQMNTEDKSAVMNEFADGRIDILVATSVIEVGVNVPNATTIIIENAERFGLAQLHQLRGRIQRSAKQAHCFLFADIHSEKTQQRLQAMETADDGFTLAEKDLDIRGPGALIGSRQSGLADIAMDALDNIELVETASNAAEDIISKDPQLADHPHLKKRVSERAEQSHFE